MKGYSQFIPLIFYRIVFIPFNYSHTIIIHYVITIVTFNSYLLNRCRLRKVKYLIFPSFIPSLTFSLSLCKSKFVSYIIFLLLENFLLKCLAGHICQQYVLFFIWDSIYFSFIFKKKNTNAWIYPGILIWLV